jgi:hypothetical protein
LRKRAKEVNIPGLDKVGIVLDCSKSMFGSKEQKLRPMAIALATRDVLIENATSAVAPSGAGAGEAGNLIRPSGSTNLAKGLAKVLRDDPDVVFVITDGYENVSAGRFAEVVEKVRAIGVDTPIHQINPVFAAETKDVRHLAEGHVPVLSVSKPAALETGLLRPLLESNPKQALLTIYERVKTQVGGGQVNEPPLIAQSGRRE